MAQLVFYPGPAEAAANIARVRGDFAGDRMWLAAAKLARLLVKYSPSQPRAPAGNPDGGQWTSVAGGDEEDETTGRSEEGDILGAARQSAFSNNIQALRRLEPDNPNLEYVTDGSSPSWDTVNRIQDEVEAAQNRVANKIAAGHALADHAGELGAASQVDVAMIVRQIISDPSAQVQDLPRSRTSFYVPSSNTLVIVDPGNADGGTVFKPINAQAYVNGLKEKSP